jgi:hypothetical protein
MTVQSAQVGRLSGWHDRVGKRHRLVVTANGGRYVYVGTITRCSPTQAIIRMRAEYDNHKGDTRTSIVEIPTDVIDPTSIRELRPGESVG